jgi:serine/threonine-protein kinase
LSSSETELRSHIERALSEQYRLDREIGRGGMGIVYRALDLRLKRTVAIKILPPELAFRSEIRSRFLREAELAAQLSHPNIVPIYAVDELDNLVFFVMACIEGRNVAQIIHERGRLDGDETRGIMRQVGSALAYAHSRGVVHRDIKPDNIIIEEKGGRAMVTDFGIARAVTDTDSRLTVTGIAIGTPAFMSPEQSMGEKEIDGRSDLYSLGVVAWQMLCGSLPFQAANTPAMLMKHISEKPPRIESIRSDVPPELARAIMVLLEKAPERRFPNAAALIAVLEGGDFPGEQPSAGNREMAAPKPPAWEAPRYESPYDTPEENAYVPSDVERRRWYSPAVAKFRKNLVLFVPVNVVLLIFAVFTSQNLLTISFVWSLYLAYRYAGLWSEGLGWRDVFRQPRHRTILDITSEALDELESLSNPASRRKLRERVRQRGLRSTPASADGRPLRGGIQADNNGAGRSRPDSHGDPVARAAADKEEISRIIASMPRNERAPLKDVEVAASHLFNRVVAYSSLPPTGESRNSDARQTIQREIRVLESQANPLEGERSEQRVRRLAFLKRQHRSLTDAEDGAAATRRMDECAVALHSMRLDLVRLRAGDQSLGQVTLLAQQAMSLADEVDGALRAAEQVAALGRESQSRGGDSR